MSMNKFAGKRRLISTAMAAGLVACAFEGTTCTVNVDDAALQQLGDVISNLDITGSGTIQVGNGSHGGHDGHHGHGDDHGDWHDHDD